MKFVSNRNIVVRSTSGHSIDFKKGEPTYVPPQMREFVLEKGILPVDGEGLPVDPAENTVVLEEKPILLAPDDGDELDKQILAVVEKIVSRNNADDFAGGGCPSAKAVSHALHYKVDQKSVKKVWEKHRQRLMNPTTE